MKSNSTFRIVSEPRASLKQRKFVEQSLYAFNLAESGHIKIDPVNVFAKDARGKILGGLLGQIWGGWLYIRILWVDESQRRSGLGRRLMQAAERVAQRKRCVGCYLDTLSFQARPFYEKLGYRVFGTLRDLPVGYTKYCLAKRLSPARRASKRKPRRNLAPAQNPRRAAGARRPRSGSGSAS